MFPKKLLILIGALFLIILILGAVLVLSDKPQSTPLRQGYEGQAIEQNTKADQEIVEQPTDAGKDKPAAIKEFDDSFLHTKTEPVSPSTQDQTKAEIKLFVRNFLEDYSSFSSNSGYDHIQDLYDKMTSKFRGYTEDWVGGDPARQKSNSFYSIQTMTMVSDVEIREFSSSKAKLILDTVRIETNAPEYYSRRFSQKAEVEVVKIGKEWKVGSVYWR